jgi:hypothetical protein
MSTETPEIYLAVTLVARIHPGDREAIDEAIQTILCPFGHFEEAGEPYDPHNVCKMDWYASTGTDNIEAALDWVAPPVPEDASTLETP